MLVALKYNKVILAFRKVGTNKEKNVYELSMFLRGISTNLQARKLIFNLYDEIVLMLSKKVYLDSWLRSCTFQPP